MRRILIILGTFAAGLLCVGLGFLVGFMLGFPVGANPPPVEWVALGKPPVPIKHLLSGSAYSVYVETNNGQIFARDTSCVSDPCWETVDLINSSDWSDQYLTISASCKIEDFEEIKQTHGQLLECASLKYLPMPDGWITAYYVLLEDGSVWVWRYARSSLDTRIGYVTGLFYGLIGCVVASAFYMFVIVAYTIGRHVSTNL